MLTHLNAKAAHLGIVEKFITQIELKLLRDPSGMDSYSPVREALEDLRELAVDDDPETTARVERHLEQALETWQLHLAARDECIEAYHIRRYCDGLREPLKPVAFLAMARFYRAIPRTRHTQSKFDLVLTRAFSTTISDMFRSMSMPRGQIQAKLERMYGEWDGAEYVRCEDAAAVKGFDRFIAENDQLLDFASLRASRQFDRIREYKTELGDRFWEPAVAAAAVECNIVVGNRLNGLMARESENLGERFGAEFDFAGTLQDTSPNAGERVSEVLREMDMQDPLISATSSPVDQTLVRTIIDLSSSSTENESSSFHVLGDRFDVAIKELRDGRITIGQCEDLLGVSTGLDPKVTESLNAPGPVELEALRSMFALSVISALDVSAYMEPDGKASVADEIGRAEIAASRLTNHSILPSERIGNSLLANALLRQILMTERKLQNDLHMHAISNPPRPEIIN